MHPFFFGSSDRALFGMYYAPRGEVERNHSVLLCNPFGHESIRSHRLMRQLAERLANDGEHVLRFDYYGTGDSSGKSELGSFDEWVSDTRSAIQEIVDMSAVPRVTVVGLRFGAVMGLYAARGRTDVDRLLLWDPVVSGQAHIEELAVLHAQRTGNPVPLGSDGVPTELVGFALGPRIGLPLAECRLAELSEWPVQEVAMIVSERLPDYDRLSHRLAELVGESPYARVPASMHWNDVAHIGELLQAPLALDAVQSMVSRKNGR